MSAFDAEPWHDLYVMMGGAAAALAGLIFVAVSLNHTQILAGVKLTSLAARTLSLLIATVLFCALGLVPQPVTVLGVELLVLGAALLVQMSLTSLRGRKRDDPLRWTLGNLATALAASVAGPVAGVSLLAHAGGGLVWLLVQLLAGVVVGAYFAWVLLIEIRR